MKSLLIAAIAHQINAAYCASLGDDSQPAWADAADWQKQSAMVGVEMHLANPDATPEQSHESWLAQKTAEGWKYGKVKDADKKEHPCFMPYADLPQAQKSKDYLFRAVVHALKDVPDADDIKSAVAQYQKQLGSVMARSGAAASQDPNVAAAVAVQYIGRREEWRDSIYDTGLYFVQNQTRYLPAEVARKLLQHQDQFAMGEPEPEVEMGLAKPKEPTNELTDDTLDLLKKAQESKKVEETTLNEVQDAIDSINRMDKAAIVNFAHEKYQQNLNKKSNLDTLRQQATQLINQFGVV